MTIRWHRKAIVGLVIAGVLAAVFAAQLVWPLVESAPRGVTRTYYVAADEVEWDYAPLGYNGISGEEFGEAENVFVENTAYTIGSRYVKALYREYTDDTFTTLKPRPPEWEHLGTLGPLLRGAVGDTIVVVFKNNAQFEFSVHPHGVFYLKDSEGAPYDDGTEDKDDDAVPPGGMHTYRWEIPERAGPGPMDGSSILWMYHSHVDEPGDTNAGLIGPMIVTRRAMARGDGMPMDVHREFVNLFTVFDENRSPYLRENIETYIIDEHWSEFKDDEAWKDAFIESLLEDEMFAESNLMHSINGYVYGNLPGLVMDAGERVRWYLLGMGTEVDLHTPHWHGQSVVIMGMRTDIAELLPASMKVADMVPDNVGVWLYHCHVNDHIDAGMIATFTVK